MPKTKSAKKALRQGIRRLARNLIYKKRVKEFFKEVKSLTFQKNEENLKKLLPKIYGILDKAAKAGVIKKGTAARKKSRICRRQQCRFG